MYEIFNDTLEKVKVKEFDKSENPEDYVQFLQENFTQ